MDVLRSVLRTAAQAVVGTLFTYLAAKGFDVPEAVQAWLRDFVLVGGGIAVYTAAVRLLETREGDSVLAKACRALARLLMLGLGGAKPVYLSAGQRAQVTYDGVVRRA